MHTKRGDDNKAAMPTGLGGLDGAEPTLRLIMRRLREIMGAPGDGQSRLDRIVRQIAGLMVAEVCSIYLRRQDGSLELFATEGLNREAVHRTFMRRGEGLVGRCAELGVVVNETDASNHPAFSYRPETGEEIYHALLAVPIQRGGGDVLGVLTVQNRAQRTYSDEDEEVLATTAMVLAEHIVSGHVAGAMPTTEADRSGSTIHGQSISEGLALGHVVLHALAEPIADLESDDPEREKERLEAAVSKLREAVEEMLGQEAISGEGEHREVLETYRMFALDRGWLRRMLEVVKSGLTAEAAVDRVRNDMRARMLRNREAHWRERQKDFDALSDRLQRILAEREGKTVATGELPPDAVLVARTLGPAELLDYDRTKLRGLVVEDGSGQSHLAVVAKALGIAAVGQARGIVDRVVEGMAIIVDAMTGEVHLRPQPEVVRAYSDKARFRARQQSKYAELRTRPAVTKDGQRVSLLINAGLQVDVPHITESGAEGIGLYRTELSFMLSKTMPKLTEQEQIYAAVLDEAAGRPVVFRTLDIGADKLLPYMEPIEEPNPALGWRAIRMTLDRSGLLRTQLRAMLRAAAGRELRLMLPMVSVVGEISSARAMLERELELVAKRPGGAPTRVLLGAMLEVPALLFELDRVLTCVDFVSVGSNDLMQYLFAADRTNDRVANRFDMLSISGLRALRSIADACRRHGVPVTMCGEMSGRPIEAMALIGLGFRSLSMAPASIGPIKSMVLSMQAGVVGNRLTELLAEGGAAANVSVRAELQRLAEAYEIET